MKKGTFLFAFTALVLANIIAYSCQKEAPSNTTPAPQELVSSDRSLACPSITLINGAGLRICGIDTGGPCAAPCTTTGTFGANIVATPATYGTVNNDYFALTNTTFANITVTIEFNCAGAGQVFVIPAGKTVTFRIVQTLNGCCQALSPC